MTDNKAFQFLALLPTAQTAIVVDPHLPTIP
jgi:hypothetical protein